MTLADAIAKAHQLNEDKIAAGVGRVAPPLEPDESLLLEHFTRFCSLSGVKNLGCRPQVIVGYIRSEKGADPYRIAATVAAIGRFHDYHGLPDPCTASCVRAELGKILNIQPPRSWRKEEKLLFMGLPVEIRAVIERREHQRETEIRRLQNECAEAKRQAQTLGTIHLPQSRFAGTAIRIRPTSPAVIASIVRAQLSTQLRFDLGAKSFVGAGPETASAKP